MMLIEKTNQYYFTCIWSTEVLLLLVKQDIGILVGIAGGRRVRIDGVQATNQGCHH